MDTMGQMGMTTATRLSTARAVGVLRVADYDRAVRYYTNVLGLQVMKHGESGSTVVAGMGSAFEIYENPALPAPQNTTLIFGVPSVDFDATMAELRDRGVIFEDYDIPEMHLKTVGGIAEMDGRRMAWFKDSEGNILGLGGT